MASTKMAVTNTASLNYYTGISTTGTAITTLNAIPATYTINSSGYVNPIGWYQDNDFDFKSYFNLDNYIKKQSNDGLILTQRDVLREYNKRMAYTNKVS